MRRRYRSENIMEHYPQKITGGGGWGGWGSRERE